MNIVSYLNTTKEEIINKSHNIWLGISLGNKYFTKENIREYIIWALNNTKQGVLVVIADALHAVNLEVLDHRSPKRALDKAVRIGEERSKEIQEVISSLSENQRGMVRIAKWKDVSSHESYKINFELIKNYYKNNREFRELIYTLLPYPGLSKLNDLALGLSDKTIFPDLASKLKITHRVGIVEAYVH